MQLAKRSLGQNFLKDYNIIKKIINLVEIEDKNVLEEPGKGALTYEILKVKSLMLIEKDISLAKALKENSKMRKCKVFNSDILNFDLERRLNHEQLFLKSPI